MSRLSAAEKQRQYRARRNADPEKRAAYLQKHRETWQENKQRGKVKAVKDLSEKETSILEKSPTSDQREKESDRETVYPTPES